MTRQTDHTHVMGKILATELCSNACISAEFVNFLLQIAISEGASQLVTRGGQIIQVVATGQFHSLEGKLRRQPLPQAPDGMADRLKCPMRAAYQPRK